MTSRRKSARPASRWMGLSIVALLATPALAQSPSDLFYERTVMTAAGERCALFAPDTAAALAAAAGQARGAALRAGMTPKALAGIENSARTRGLRTDCAAADTAAAAVRVREAFAGFAKVTRLSYPGELASWQADRSITKGARWRLMQQARFGGGDRLTFGMAGASSPGVLLAMGQFADNGRPYAARLVLRDRERTLGPYLPHGVGATPLARRMPPVSALTTFTAQARSQAGADLLPKDATSGWAFRFPDNAARALAELDPREAVAVEFVFPDNSVRRAYVEVGDFAAGRAFLQVAAR